ncbi:MAG: hypothetical protein LBH21_08005, partial [Gracilibacteraceae bacterium]|nr:hypothetical protein [Gracilibacteraceae bacterium]
MNTKQKSKKWSKPLSVLLMLTLALSMLPAAAGAASEKRAAALDCTIFSNDVENYLATQGWSWNYASKTLTLNDVDIDTSDFSAVILPHGATVVLSGDNLIASTNEARYSNGIYCKGDATFKGDGSVTIKGVALGIICEANGNSGNIVVSENARITVEDAKSTAISIPIGEGSFSRTLTIRDNARVNVNNAAGSAISVSDYVTIQDNA